MRTHVEHEISFSRITPCRNVKSLALSYFFPLFHKFSTIYIQNIKMFQCIIPIDIKMEIIIFEINIAVFLLFKFFFKNALRETAIRIFRPRQKMSRTFGFPSG